MSFRKDRGARELPSTYEYPEYSRASEAVEIASETVVMGRAARELPTRRLEAVRTVRDNMLNPRSHERAKIEKCGRKNFVAPKVLEGDRIDRIFLASLGPWRWLDAAGLDTHYSSLVQLNVNLYDV